MDPGTPVSLEKGHGEGLAELGAYKEPRRQNEEEAFDSGTYSEAYDGICPANGIPEPFSMHSVQILSVGSPGVKRRTTSHPEFKSEEYLYSPSASITSMCSPLAASTPIQVKPSSPALSVASSSSSHLSPYLQNLLVNFNSLYQKKLEDAENMAKSSPDGTNPLVIKYAVMEDWVRDLNEQNTVLIETVDEMEKEAEEKIHLLQGKVQRSAQMLMEHMSIIQEYEKQAQGFIKNREETEYHLQLFYDQADELLNKKKALEDKLEAVELEHASLLKLITRIRDWGVWDISGLKIDPRTYKQLFDLYPSLPGSEVQTVFTQDRARQVRKNEKRLEFLEAEFLKIQEDETTNQILSLEKEKLIADLQRERDELHTKISALEQENQDYRRKLEETHGLLTQTILNSSHGTSNLSGSEFKDLVNDMKLLKEELQTAKSERHVAMTEARVLKTEMNSRLSDLSELKNLLITLQTESETAKENINEILEKQEKFACLEEQVKFYQDKYIEASRLISNKTLTTERLQERMDELYEKMRKRRDKVEGWIDGGDSFTVSQITTLMMNENENLSYTQTQPQHPDLLMSSVKELQIRLRRLEEESTEKDVIVGNLQRELIAIKNAKEEIQAHFSSREAEIQMQKELIKRVAGTDGDWGSHPNPMRIEQDFLRGKLTRKKDRSDADSPRSWTKNEIDFAEKALQKLKLDNEALNLRTELMQKNLLIYQTHQFLTQLEDNYLPSNSSSSEEVNSKLDIAAASNQEEAGSHPDPENSRLAEKESDVSPDLRCYSTFRFKNNERRLDNTAATQAHDLLQSSSSSDDELNSEFALQLSRRCANIGLCGLYANTATENVELKKKLKECRREFRRFRRITCDENRASTINESRPVDIGYSRTEWKHSPGKQITPPPQTPKCITKYTATTSKYAERVRQSGDPAGKKLAMDEIIRLQGEQIERYETYVKRLHEEIRAWINPGGVAIPPTKILDPSACDSVIGALQDKIERDIQLFESNEATNAELNLKLKNLKIELENLKKSEAGLALENKILSDIIAGMNQYFLMRKSGT